MQQRGWKQWPTVLAAVALLLSGWAQPVSAQTGNDNVTFWDDPGQTSSTADVPAPADMAVEGYSEEAVVLNPNGGRTTDDGLYVIVAPMGIQVIRDRDWQIYDSSIDQGSMAWILYSEEYCVGSDLDCRGNSNASRGTVVDGNNLWTVDTVDLIQDGPTTWIARTTEAYTIGSRTYTVTTDISYTPPSPYIDLTATVTVDPSYSGTTYLYLTADMYLDGNDRGPGYFSSYGANQILVQANDSSVGGIAETGRPFDSYFEGEYSCIYPTIAATSYSLVKCGNTTEHWTIDEGTEAAWFGPAVGEPYPSPAIINGRSSTTAESAIDAGVAAQWDVSTNRTVTTSLVFLSRAAYDSPPDDGGGDGGGSGGGEEPGTTPQPAVCEQLPDIAVDPQFINLAPGGRATVTVTLRNLCNDAPLRSSDLLLSLSDGLRIVGGSNGLVNLSQRGAIQGLTLYPDETRSWTFEVEAGASLPTDPLFVVELYQGSGVASRIDGVFINPAPAPAEPAPAPVVEVPAPAPAEAAPLPAALPNTGATDNSLPLSVLLLATVALVSGITLIRKKRSF